MRKLQNFLTKARNNFLRTLWKNETHGTRWSMNKIELVMYKESIVETEKGNRLLKKEIKLKHYKKPCGP